MINGALLLGFLKFLKREKRKEPNLDLKDIEDFDIPPSPPESKKKLVVSGEKELPELPEMPKLDDTFPEPPEVSPELPSIDEEPMPELELPNLKGMPRPEDNMLESKLPHPSRPLFGIRKPKEPLLSPYKPPQNHKIFSGIQKSKPLFPISSAPTPVPEVRVTTDNAQQLRPYQRTEIAAVKEEQGILHHQKAKGSVYLRIDKFRNIITNTNGVKGNIKIANRSLQKLKEIDANRDKTLENWHNVMVDLQKKFIFIDKMLFKGD